MSAFEEISRIKALIDDKAVTKRAWEIVKTMKASCDRGGCNFHSGHEYCSMDAAWDSAYQQAEDEAFEVAERLKGATS